MQPNLMQISYIWCSTDFGPDYRDMLRYQCYLSLGSKRVADSFFWTCVRVGQWGRGGSLLPTWETQSVGRRACGGAASPAFQICDVWLSLTLIKLLVLFQPVWLWRAQCETQSVGRYVRGWNYETRSLLILGKFKLKRGEILPAILIPDSDM